MMIFSKIFAILITLLLTPLTLSHAITVEGILNPSISYSSYLAGPDSDRPGSRSFTIAQTPPYIPDIPFPPPSPPPSPPPTPPPSPAPPLKPILCPRQSTLPSASAGLRYSHQLDVQRGTPPYTYHLIREHGAAYNLPDGLTLSRSGLISGTPRASGRFLFTVRVEDGAKQSSDCAISISVVPSCSAQSVIPAATAGLPYHHQLSIIGGAQGLTYKAVPGSGNLNNLPQGLTLSPSGLISGAPLAKGTFTFLVKAEDASQQYVQCPYSLTVNPAPLSVRETPNLFSLRRDQQATRNVIYNFSSHSGIIATVSSAKGVFQAGGRTIGENNTPSSLFMRNGAGQYSETISIPLAVIRKAAELGFSKFTYVRTWSSDLTASATSTITFSTVLDSAASLEITAIRLYFDNQQPKITVKRNRERLKAFADIRIIGRGVLDCYFEADGRLHSRIVKHIDHAREQTLTIETPDSTPLRTFDEGEHRVRLVVNQPRTDIDFPIAIYHVTSESQLSVILLEPEDNAQGDVSAIRFKWSRPKPDLNYRIEFSSEGEGKPFFSAETLYNDYSIPKLILKTKVAPGQEIFWRVKAFDKEGKPSGESEERRFNSLTTDQQLIVKPGLKQTPPFAPKQPESQKSGKPLTPALKMPSLPDEDMRYTSGGWIFVTDPKWKHMWVQGIQYDIKWEISNQLAWWYTDLMFPPTFVIEILNMNNTSQAVETFSSHNFLPNERYYKYSWQIPANFLLGNYTIKVSAPDWKLSGNSHPFEIISPVVIMAPTLLLASKKINITKPSTSETWIPLKNYMVEWKFQDGIPANGFNISLIPVGQSASGGKIQLRNKYTSFSYTGVLWNVNPGDYMVRVELYDDPNVYDLSPVITVKSTLGPDTVFLGPDASKNEVDLSLIDVTYDPFNGLQYKVKNLGGQFKGNVVVDIELTSDTDVFGCPKMNKKENQWIDLKPNEEINLKYETYVHWNIPEEIGWPYYSKSEFYPDVAACGPMYAKIGISPSIGLDVNLANNWVKKKICRVQTAEIATGGEITIFTGKEHHVSIYRNASRQVYPGQIAKWIDKDTFEATIQVKLGNQGCQDKTFDSWLYVDKSPGQFLGKETISSGEWKEVTFPNPVKIKVPPGKNKVMLVFIADPEENNDQPYPNSYMNNFIPVTLEIVGGTVEGSGF